jgi:hypothetical protein
MYICIYVYTHLYIGIHIDSTVCVQERRSCLDALAIKNQNAFCYKIHRYFYGRFDLSFERSFFFLIVINKLHQFDIPREKTKRSMFNTQVSYLKVYYGG